MATVNPPKLVDSDAWMTPILEWLGVDPAMVTKLTIDAVAGEPLIIRIAMVANEETARALAEGAREAANDGA